jgi:hypothetical protein
MDTRLGGSACLCNGIKAIMIPGPQPIARVYLMLDGERLIALDEAADPNQPIAFKLTIDNQNRLALQVGQSRKVAMPSHAARDAVRMGCGAADVSFTYLDAETTVSP